MAFRAYMQQNEYSTGRYVAPIQDEDHKPQFQPRNIQSAPVDSQTEDRSMDDLSIEDIRPENEYGTNYGEPVQRPPMQRRMSHSVYQLVDEQNPAPRFPQRGGERPRATQWIPQNIVDSRQFVHDYNLKQMEDQINVKPQPPAPKRRLKEFILPYGAEEQLQEQYGHSVPIKTPVRQQFNRPDVLPQEDGYQEYRLATDPRYKTPIKSTFDTNPDAIDRRRYQNDAIQVEPAAPIHRGGHVQPVVYAQGAVYDDRDAVIHEPSIRGGHVQDPEYIHHQETLAEHDSYQQPIPHGTRISVREMAEQAASYRLNSRTVAPRWRDEKTVDDRFISDGSRMTGKQVTAVPVARSRDVRVRDMEYTQNDSNPIMGTDLRTAGNKRGGMDSVRDVAGGSRVNARDINTPLRPAVVRGATTKDPVMGKQLEYPELGTQVNALEQPINHGLRTADDRRNQSPSGFDVDTTQRHKPLLLGTAIEDDRSYEDADRVNVREWNLRDQPKIRGQRTRDHEMMDAMPGGVHGEIGQMQHNPRGTRGEMRNPRIPAGHNRPTEDIVPDNKQRRRAIHAQNQRLTGERAAGALDMGRVDREPVSRMRTRNESRSMNERDTEPAVPTGNVNERIQSRRKPSNHIRAKPSRDNREEVDVIRQYMDVPSPV